MISAEVPVSPRRGKMRVMLFVCDSRLASVIASTASAPLNPSSWAKRAVDSTPKLVEMPAITICVTPSFSRYSRSPVLVNAPHGRFVSV
jgi:hypothetical protein